MEMHCSKRVFCCVAGVVLGVTSVFLVQAASAADGTWKPEGVIEVIVNTAPGSSPDKTARLMQKIFQQNGLVTIPATVVNKPGGGGAVAYTYLNQYEGSGNHIAIASKTLLTTHIMGRSPFTYTDVTPIAHLFGEYIGIAVKADSPIQSGRDLIDRLKRDPGSHSLGVATSLGNTNHQAVAAAMKAAGIDPRALRTVVFQSGGQAITALLGGHVDVVPVSIGSWRSHLESGTVRVIAVAAPQRLAGIYAQVPTWREQGADTVVSNWRSVVGPRGMRPAQVTYWERAVERLMQTDDWKKEVEAISGASVYMNSAETRKYMAQDYAEIQAFLKDLDMAKR
jgi:putative tricarboxylic transport membrane protein